MTAAPLLLLLLLLLIAVQPADCGQRLVMSGDDIVEKAAEGGGMAVAKEPEAQGGKGLGHSQLLWSCPPGQIMSANGCVDRPKQRKKKSAAEQELARRELLTTNRVMNEYLAEHTSGKFTAEDTAAAIKAAEQYLNDYGPDTDVDLSWTEKEEYAHRTAFVALRNEQQARLDINAMAVEEAEAQVVEVEMHKRDLEAILDPSAKHSQEMGVKDIDSQQVSLMQELEELGDELQDKMAARHQLKTEHLLLYKEMLDLVQRESDRRAGLANWYTKNGLDVGQLLGDVGLPLNMNLSDAALKQRGKPKLGRKGSKFSSPAASSLAIRGTHGDFSNFLSQTGRPPSSAMVTLDVALPLPTGVKAPSCQEGASCENGVELPVLEKLAIMCENLPSNVYECNEEVGVTIPEFLIKTPDMLSVLFPDHGYIKLYEAFGGLDQTLIKLRDELIENPRELATLAEYCTALRAKGDTWEAIDCFRWSIDLVKTGQYDKDSGRWAQRNTEGQLTTIGTIATDLKINYGETALRAGLVEEAVAAFESTSAEEWLRGRKGKREDFTMGILAAGHARDVSATHTFESAQEYVDLIDRQQQGGRSSWRVHHAPEWYRWGSFVGVCRWMFGLILVSMALMRVGGFRVWIQWPTLPCIGGPSHLAICCELGGAVHVLHTRVPLPNLDNAASLAAAVAARNGSGDRDEGPISPVFLAHERGEGRRGKDAPGRDIEMKVELPSHQLVGHLELMAPLSCCRCTDGGPRRSWCSRVMCYSVAYTFADLDIQLLKVNNGHDANVSGARRRVSGGHSTEENRNASSISAIRLDFSSHTVFGASSHTHILHMEEAPGVFRLLSAIQNEGRREQRKGGMAGRTRRRR